MVRLIILGATGMLIVGGVGLLFYSAHAIREKRTKFEWRSQAKPNQRTEE